MTISYRRLLITRRLKTLIIVQMSMFTCMYMYLRKYLCTMSQQINTNMCFFTYYIFLNAFFKIYDEHIFVCQLCQPKHTINANQLLLMRRFQDLSLNGLAASTVTSAPSRVNHLCLKGGSPWPQSGPSLSTHSDTWRASDVGRLHGLR